MPHSSIDSTELPALQPWSHCVLMPRDPDVIYAYWDYTRKDIDRLRNKLKGGGKDAKPILRIYDITHIKFDGTNSNHSWDLEVGYSAKSWYVQVDGDSGEYCAELGFRKEHGRFIPLMRSNTARTPSKSVSLRNDLIWQDIKAHKESQPFIEEELEVRSNKEIHLESFSPQAGVPQTPAVHGPQSKKSESFPQLQEGEQSRSGPLPSKNQINLPTLQAKGQRKARIYFLTAQDIRDYYMNLFARVSKKGRRKGQLLSIEDFLKGKLKSLSWQKVHPVLISPDLLRRAHLSSSAGSLENKGASELLSKSPANASEGRLNKREFLFELSTELLVHGKTQPDATVTLNGKEVKLNPDGTFSLRYALAGGEIPLGFVAQSSDGIEQRLIQTRVERKKTTGTTKILKASHG